uniref:Phosphatidylserine synthase n=1 Tax=Acrobeloides nanus TaxID=290746 RepID=A0A914CHA8_9BILA
MSGQEDEGPSERLFEISDEGDSDYPEQVEETLKHSDKEYNENQNSDSKAKRSRFRKRTNTEVQRLHFRMVNERIVNDITLEAFYKPHTITVLVLLCSYLTYKAFESDDDATQSNIFGGLKATAALFLVVSAMAFPNGPFIRPHPIFWRIIFGISVMYTLVLMFTLYQSFADIKAALAWIDPVGLSAEKLDEKLYAENCSDVTLERIWSYMDIFAVGHFLGWAMKALLIRHTIICWYISISWELTEVIFAHLLPNFQECWWDAIILDVILCNGLGILFGSYVCKWLEMKSYYWESIKNIRTTHGKFKRAVLQFTPESWMKVDWFSNLGRAVKRAVGLYLFIMIWLVTELNTFFLKHIFAVETSHQVVFWRIILIGLISAPSIRQYYIFLTDPKINRLGMQCWVYCAVTALEAAICIKFGRQMFPAIKLTFITMWILFLAVGTIFAVWLSVRWARYTSLTKEVSVCGRLQDCYVDSSYENLGAISDDVRRRRRRLHLHSDGGYD